MTENTSNNRLIKIVMLSIVALIIIAVFAFYYLEPILTTRSLPTAIAINTENQPTLGNPKAPIHIVAFEDLKCSNCARFNIEMMPFIKKQYIDTGIAKYTMINVAFIPGSMPAANAAHCVYTQNHALYFDYTNYIFDHQPPENQNWTTVPNLLNYASQIKGIDINTLAQCIIKSPYDAFIHANLAQAIKLMHNGVATPTIYINGVIVRPLTKSHINHMMKAMK